RDALQQDNAIDGSPHDSDVMYGGAAFPKDRSIDVAAGKRLDASIVIFNASFAVKTHSPIDVASFAVLFIFSRMHNLEHIGAWRQKADSNSVGESVSATFLPHSTLISALNSFTSDITSTPKELEFAIRRNHQTIAAETCLTFDSVDGGLRLTLTSEKGR